jgi:hypothetical protein
MSVSVVLFLKLDHDSKRETDSSVYDITTTSSYFKQCFFHRTSLHVPFGKPQAECNLPFTEE